MSGLGQTVVVVPVSDSGLDSSCERGASGTPTVYDCRHTCPCRFTATSNLVESALTTDAPTPCRPPDTAYPPPPNLPPAWRIVCTTSTVDRPSDRKSVV